MKRKTMRARVAAAAFALTAIVLGTAARGEEPPVAVSARLMDDGDKARLSFDLSGAVNASARVLVEPDRVVVDMPQVNFQIDPAVGRVGKPREDALVRTYRFGLFGPGKSRVVIELAHPACVAKLETKPIAAGAAPARLVIALRACPRAEFAEAAKAPVRRPPLQSPRRPPPPGCR